MSAAPTSHRKQADPHPVLGHFPAEQAALKCVYLAIMSLDPTGKGRPRWTNRRKAALNAFEIAFEITFEITFDGRLSAGRR